MYSWSLNVVNSKNENPSLSICFKQQPTSLKTLFFLSFVLLIAANWYVSCSLSFSPLILLPFSFSSSLFSCWTWCDNRFLFFLNFSYSLLSSSFLLPFSSSLSKMALWQYDFVLITMLYCIYICIVLCIDV